MRKRLLITIAIIILLIVFIIGVPLSYEHSLGERSLPDSSLYEMELMGESIKCSLSLDRKACLLDLADERDQEASLLQKERNKTLDKTTRERYDFLIVAAENAAARLRIEALGG